MANDERIDKWLWAMRIFKTRSVASEACKKGRVYVDNMIVKPSKLIKCGDVIQIRKPPVTYSFEVLALSPNRLNAKLVPLYMKQVTTPDQLQLIEMIKMDQKNSRARGTGRPTKKERRDLESFVDDIPYFVDDFDMFTEDESYD